MSGDVGEMMTRRMAVLVLLWSVAAGCTSRNEVPHHVVSVRIEPENEAVFEERIERFAQKHGFTLDKKTYRGGPVETAFLLDNPATRILIREPFEEGAFKIYFYARKEGGDVTNADRAVGDFNSEVLAGLVAIT